MLVVAAGVFDPMNQGAKGPAPPLEQKSDDRYTHTRRHMHTHGHETHALVYTFEAGSWQILMC